MAVSDVSRPTVDVLDLCQNEPFAVLLVAEYQLVNIVFFPLEQLFKLQLVTRQYFWLTKKCMKLPVKEQLTNQVLRNGELSFFDVLHYLLQSLFVFDDAEQQVEEDVEYLALSVFVKCFLEFVFFQSDKIVFNEEVPAEPILFHHLVEDLHVVDRLYFLIVDVFVPVV